MSRTLLAAACGLLLSSPLLAADKATQADYDQLLQAGQFTGKVVSVGSDQSITIRLEIPTLGGVGNLSAREREILRQQEEILLSRSPAERARHMERLLQTAGGNANLRVTTTGRDFEFDVIDNAKVRIAEPPQQYDDKGNPKKYTSQELKDMKGADSKLPGYTSELGNLKVGQTVTVYLTKNPPAKKTDDKDKDNKDKDKPKDKKPEMKKPLVKMIVIQKEAPEPGNDRKKAKQNS